MGPGGSAGGASGAGNLGGVSGVPGLGGRPRGGELGPEQHPSGTGTFPRSMPGAWLMDLVSILYRSPNCERLPQAEK